MNPQNQNDTLSNDSPLTPVRSPVRGASDSVSRHDGPTQQGGTERPVQRGSVKAREASTLGGIQGHNHPTNKHLNQTRQNNDSHVCREGGFGTSPQRRAVCLAAQPQTNQLHTQGRGYPLNHTNHPKSRRLCSLLSVPPAATERSVDDRPGAPGRAILSPSLADWGLSQSKPNPGQRCL